MKILKLQNYGSNNEVFVQSEFHQDKSENTSSTKVEHSRMVKNNPGCSSNQKSFSVTRMSLLFEKCATSKYASEVDMDSYIDAWDEIVRFLNSLGKAFTFVSSDVLEKLSTLRSLRNSSAKEHYSTIKQMIIYEKERNLLTKAASKKISSSGTGTLLCLHRALKFLLILLGKLARNEDDGKVSVMGYNAYHASPMADHHPWLVRKAVDIAVYMLPDRTTFIKQLCQDLADDELAKTMQVCSESMDSVYEYTHAIYSKYDLLEFV